MGLQSERLGSYTWESGMALPRLTLQLHLLGKIVLNDPLRKKKKRSVLTETVTTSWSKNLNNLIHTQQDRWRRIRHYFVKFRSV